MKSYAVTIYPSKLKGTLSIPPAKSMLHRALIAAALANGESVIAPIILSDDVLATINAIRAIGAKVQIKADKIVVRGVKSIKAVEREVEVYDSASTLRFMIPVASLAHKPITFKMRESLSNRPQKVYNTIFGDEMVQNNQSLTIKKPLKPGIYHLDGTISSQFITGLLLTLPYLKEDSKIIVKNPSSKMYIDLTIKTLEAFNIVIKETDEGYLVKGNQTFKATSFNVDGDFSQAAFFLTAGYLHESIYAKNLYIESAQADKAYLEITKKMHGKLLNEEDGFRTMPSTLKATDIDLDANPDLGPILALLATQAEGVTTLYNAQRLRVKESDRIQSTVETLQALGANIEAEHDKMIIQGPTRLKGNKTLDSYHDHRIVMMLAIAGTICEQSITIKNAQFVNKSYPNFFEDLKHLGAKLEIQED